MFKKEKKCKKCIGKEITLKKTEASIYQRELLDTLAQGTGKFYHPGRLESERMQRGFRIWSVS